MSTSAMLPTTAIPMRGASPSADVPTRCTWPTASLNSATRLGRKPLTAIARCQPVKVASMSSRVCGNSAVSLANCPPIIVPITRRPIAPPTTVAA